MQKPRLGVLSQEGKRNRTGVHSVCVNRVKPGVAGTLTCNVGHSERLLALGPFAVGIARLSAARRGADAPQVHLGGFEEGHHEGLFVLRPVAAD